MKKNVLIERQLDALVKGVKADMKGDAEATNCNLYYASGVLSAAYAMSDCLDTEVLAKMSRADALAYDIMNDEVDDVQESLWILENNMA